MLLVPKVYVNKINVQQNDHKCKNMYSKKAEVGIYQNLASNSYFFSLITDKLTKRVKYKTIWCIIFVYDMILRENNTKVLEDKLESLRAILVKNRLKIRRNKIKCSKLRFK